MRTALVSLGADAGDLILLGYPDSELGAARRAGQVSHNRPSVRANSACATLFTVATAIVMALSAIILIYGGDVIPDLRPCTSTTMGCAADRDGGSCEAGMWRLRPTFCSGP